MKIIKKNFIFLSLLMAAYVPTTTKPIFPSLAVAVIVSAQFLTSVSVGYSAFTYIPYLIVTRHRSAQNFVKHQTDIQSYELVVETRKSGETLVAQSFNGPDYRTVINDTLAYLHTQVHAFAPPTHRARFSVQLKNETLILLQPRITLAKDETVYELRRLPVIFPTDPQQATRSWKKLEKNLIDRFTLPRIKSYGSPLPYVLFGTTLLILPEFLGLLTLIPAAIIGIPLFLKQQFHYSSAQHFVNRQEDIESYSVTVKIKRHVKTIKEQAFSGPDYQTVMNDALLYAYAEQTTGLRTVFKPSITLVDDEQVYPLRNIVKKTLPKKPSHIARYWRRLASSLTDRFVIPADDSANLTNMNRIAYFGLESGAWMLSPYVAVLPFLL
jgi:hypothetical protein